MKDLQHWVTKSLLALMSKNNCIELLIAADKIQSDEVQNAVAMVAPYETQFCAEYTFINARALSPPFLNQPCTCFCCAFFLILFFPLLFFSFCRNSFFCDIALLPGYAALPSAHPELFRKLALAARQHPQAHAAAPALSFFHRSPSVGSKRPAGF